MAEIKSLYPATEAVSDFLWVMGLPSVFYALLVLVSVWGGSGVVVAVVCGHYLGCAAFVAGSIYRRWSIWRREDEIDG